MLKIIFILFLCELFVPSLCEYELGGPCFEKNVTGVCKSIYECPYAKREVQVDHVHPPICFFEDTLEIVCCSTKNIFHKLGVFKDYFTELASGIKTSKSMTCRYSGVQPIKCCEKDKPVKIPAEDGCPKLIRPKLNTDKPHIAWSKCLDYQRYFNQCISEGPSMNPYKFRKYSCSIPRYVERIAAGRVATSKEFPHMAVLGCRNPKENDTDIIWVGAGALISERFILTAAHVLIEPTLGVVTYALLGALNKTDTLSGYLFNILSRIPYNYYKYNGHEHDIALIELDRQVFFNEFIRPACLPVPGLDVSKMYTIAGWGATRAGSSGSDVLLATELRASNDCESRTKFTDFVWSNVTSICAKGVNGEDSCEGDSGGPLMAEIHNINCSYSIEGVISYGPNCGKNSPGVYTRVSYYLDWIVENVWPNEK